jgi:hypothetical protein
MIRGGRAESCRDGAASRNGMVRAASHLGMVRQVIPGWQVLTGCFSRVTSGVTL